MKSTTKKNQKKFSETKIGEFIQKTAPDILEVIGTSFPPASIISELLKLKGIINSSNSDTISKLLSYYQLYELNEYNENTKDARDMQKTALQQDDKFSKRFIYYLAAFATFISFIYIFAITFFAVPTESQRFSDTTLGVIIAGVLSVIFNYFFGSSLKSTNYTNKNINNN